MRRSMLVVLSFAAVLAFSGLARAETLSGTVVDRGAGGMRVKTQAGAEVVVRFERGAKFSPADFRPYRGDEVEFSGEKKTSRRSNEEYFGVTEMKALKVHPQNTFQSPVIGRVVAVGAGASVGAGLRAAFGVGRSSSNDVRIFVESANDEVVFERASGTPSVENDIKYPSPGDKVKVYFNRQPARIGDGYAYILHGLQKAE